MKLLIASDLHGSAFYCEKLLALLEKEQAERVLLLGDVLYHGPRNDLPQGYDPKKVTAMLTGLSVPILGVRGNCDAEIDQTVLGFPLLSDFALILEGTRTLFATHGHLYTPEQHPRLNEGDAFVFGHIHVPVCQTRGGILYLNPGSVSMPKDGTAHGCMTLSDGVFRWLDLEGHVLREQVWA